MKKTLKLFKVYLLIGFAFMFSCKDESETSASKSMRSQTSLLDSLEISEDYMRGAVYYSMRYFVDEYMRQPESFQELYTGCLAHADSISSASGFASTKLLERLATIELLGVDRFRITKTDTTLVVIFDDNERTIVIDESFKVWSNTADFCTFVNDYFSQIVTNIIMYGSYMAVVYKGDDSYGIFNNTQKKKLINKKIELILKGHYESKIGFEESYTTDEIRTWLNSDQDKFLLKVSKSEIKTVCGNHEKLRKIFNLDRLHKELTSEADSVILYLSLDSYLGK